MTDSAVVDSALVDAALRKSGLKKMDVPALSYIYAAWYINLNCFSNHQLQWK
jgi:hypothetical protein